MKTTLFTTLIISVLLFSSVDSKACVEQHPDSIFTRLLIDSTNCDMVLEISNLRLMGSEPNHFCSCGVNDIITFYGDVLYVSFVDSITEEPIIGFDQFDPNLSAGDSWSGAEGMGIDWDGFVSNVNSNGLLQDQAVKLWIRLDYIDQGFGCSEPNWLNELFVTGAFGTDEWDNDNQQLSEDHQSISYFGEEVIIEYLPNLEYYDSIILGLDEKEQEVLSIYPNPSNGIIHIDNIGQQAVTKIYNMSGQQLYETKATREVDLSHLPHGIYYLQLHQNEKIYTQKLILN